MELNVFGIKGTESFLIKAGTLNHKNPWKFFLNDKELSTNDTSRVDLIINPEDKFQTLSPSKTLVDYRRGEEIISVDYFCSKPQYYDEDSSDEETLRAIANKKELSGFQAHYKIPELQDVNTKIIGWIENTGSVFIDCTVTSSSYNPVVIFTISGNRIAMDEYNKLREEYSEHARFEKPDRNYLRFTKINNHYAFHDSYPFGDYEYRKQLSSLDEASSEEENIRKSVKNAVVKAVFKPSLTETKKIQLISQLNSIKKLKTKKSMEEMLSVLIEDLSEYVGNIN